MPGEPRIAFKMLRQIFKNYLLVLGATGNPWSDASRRATVSHCLGTEEQRLFYSRPDTGSTLQHRNDGIGELLHAQDKRRRWTPGLFVRGLRCGMKLSFITPEWIGARRRLLPQKGPRLSVQNVEEEGQLSCTSTRHSPGTLSVTLPPWVLFPLSPHQPFLLLMLSEERSCIERDLETMLVLSKELPALTSTWTFSAVLLGLDRE